MQVFDKNKDGRLDLNDMARYLIKLLWLMDIHKWILFWRGMFSYNKNMIEK